MPRKVIADSSALVAFLSRDDQHHDWIAAQAGSLPAPWLTCEPALTETFHLLGNKGTPKLKDLLRRGALVLAFELRGELEPVLTLMDKYSALRPPPSVLRNSALETRTGVSEGGVWEFRNEV